MSSRAVNRINFGMTGGAKCHATDGWFCEEVWHPLVRFTLSINRKLRFTLER